jgi:hypothetical protein
VNNFVHQHSLMFFFTAPDDAMLFGALWQDFEANNLLADCHSLFL